MIVGYGWESCATGEGDMIDADGFIRGHPGLQCGPDHREHPAYGVC